MKKKSLAINAFYSCIKTLTTIIFPLITYPYITRILSVEDIGSINFGHSIVSYFSLLAALGINTFAVRNGSQIRDDENDLNIFSRRIFTINIVTTVISCALLIVLVFLPTRIADFRAIILIQGVTVALSPFAVTWLYTIEEDFRYITLRSFFIYLLSLVLMFIFVKSESDVYLYVILTTASTSFANIFNFIHAKKYVKLGLIRDTHWKEYFRPIMVFFANNIATVIYLNSDTTILGLLSGSYSVGLYSVAVKIYSIVKQLFNAVIATTIPRLAYLYNRDRQQFGSLVQKLVSVTLFFVVPASFGMVILRKEIVMLISGERYIQASPTLAILSIAIIFAVFANIFANGVLICLGKERYVMKATIISAIVNISMNFIFIPSLSQNGAAMTTLVAEIIVCCFSFHYCKDIIMELIDVKEIRNVLISSFLMLGFGIIFYRFVSLQMLVLRIIVIILTSSTVYLICMLLFKDKVLKMLFDVIKSKSRIHNK